MPAAFMYVYTCLQRVATCDNMYVWIRLQRLYTYTHACNALPRPCAMVLESGCSPDAAVMPLYIHIHPYTYIYIDIQIYRYGQALANAGAMLSAEGHLGMTAASGLQPERLVHCLCCHMQAYTYVYIVIRPIPALGAWQQRRDCNLSASSTAPAFCIVKPQL